MAGSVVYDGVVSGAAIAAAMTISAASVFAVPYSNGQRILIVPTIKIDGTETPTLSGSLVISGAEAYVAFDGGLKQITN